MYKTPCLEHVNSIPITQNKAHFHCCTFWNKSNLCWHFSNEKNKTWKNIMKVACKMKRVRQITSILHTVAQQ